jgi:CDP-diacylglycerol--glycerol-3-phosphate 3-phosphatidyltransferase
MLSARFGHFLDKPLASFARKIDVDPNLVTIAGFLITTVAAITLTQNLVAGGVLILCGGFLDMMDGIIARVNRRATKFGAFLDSVLDRYSDAFLLLGFSWYFLKDDSLTGLSLCMGTLVGALIISYTKARAEGLGENCHTGLMERPDRIIFMALAAFTGWVLPIMWIMIVLTHITVIQRIHHVWKIMKR